MKADGKMIESVSLDWKSKGAHDVFRFPADWTLFEYKQKDTQKMAEQDVKEFFTSGFEFKGRFLTIKELSEGKSSVVILVDDLTRFTPAYRIIPYILDELLKAGIKQGQISFMMAGGTHRPWSREEMSLKVGQKIADAYHLECHNAFDDDVVFMGITDYGTPVKINRKVAEADLVIGIGMMSKHHNAYVSGGAKIILPGIAHVDSVRHHHDSKVELGTDEEKKYGYYRAGINAAGRLFAGLTDFVAINLTLDRDRDITGIYMGDCVDIFMKNAQTIRFANGVDFCRSDYGASGKADIGVFKIDTLDPLQIYKGIYENSKVCHICVAVGDFSDKYRYQGKGCGPYHDFLERMNHYDFEPYPPVSEALKSGIRIYIVSSVIDKKSIRKESPHLYVQDQFDELIMELHDHLGENLKVAFFHDAYTHELNIIG